jgi:multiple sugar transport system ATP-binding protein
VTAIRLEGLRKVYPNGVEAVAGLDLEVAAGELFVVVGPSGCGKTTTLRLVAGLEAPTAGRVFLGGRDVTSLPPHGRDVAMVFQGGALYPDKTVRGNLGFGLRLRRTPTTVIAERVARVARDLGLEDVLERRPDQLSAGQQQRVALGRALVRRPQAFLLDEPLSHLDAPLRIQTREELARLQRRLGATMLHVTHDQEEALALGDRLAVLREGRLQQVGSPAEVHDRPANVFVAGFLGSPPMNFFPCTLGSEDGRPILRSAFFTLSLQGVEPAAEGEYLLGVRPHDVRVADVAASDVMARADRVRPLGGGLLVHLRLSGGGAEAIVVAVLPPGTGMRTSDQVPLFFRREALHLFGASDGRRLA